VLALQEREAQVGTEINEAQNRFSKEAGRKPYADYDLKDDFDKWRANIREKLDRLARSSLVTLNDNDPDYQTLTKDLAQLESVAKEWKKFGSELVALEAALKSATASVKDAPRPSDWPHEPRTEEPTFLPEARKLLRGKKLTVESSESQPGADNSFVSQRGKVKQATALARSWGTMNDLVGRCMGRVKELDRRKGGMSPAQLVQLGRAKGVLSEAHYELWHAKNADELKRKTTEQDLNDAERSLLQLLPLLVEQAPPDGEQDVAAEPMMLETALNQVKSIVAELDSDGLDVAKAEPPEDVARASSYADAREKADWRLWWLAVGLALVTGLGALYIGKPFGTFWDYLSAVAWGVGAVLTLSALNAALEGLPSPRELLGSVKTPQ
jgi:hypothetical protein